MTQWLKIHGLFLAAIALFVGVMGGLIYEQEKIISDGDTIILATRPVDPRDLFRGEYVILRYAIESDERVRAMTFRGDGTPLYIKLRPDERGVGQIDEVQVSVPYNRPGIWLEGEVRSGEVLFPDLEQFYVPEGQGKKIESLREKLHVEVRIKNGVARVVGVRDGNLAPISLTE